MDMRVVLFRFTAMQELPKSYIGLPVHCLSQVFNNTTNSYKFYWFLAILDHIKSNDSRIIPMRSLALQMLENVWYPLDFYKLSFGKQDGFSQLAKAVNSTIKSKDEYYKSSLIEQLQKQAPEKEFDAFLKRVSTLTRYVPFAFQSSFFSTELKGINKSSEREKITVKQANKVFMEGRGGCLYRYLNEGNKIQNIEIEPQWLDYLQGHLGILYDFSHWNLVRFLQKRNPTVIGISEKLNRPTNRNNDLSKITKTFWKPFLTSNPHVSCIYTQTPLIQQKYAIDHFVPWSYVVHNEVWNLVPVNASANSSKSNSLPHQSYLEQFSHIQYQAYQYAYQHREELSKVEDFLDSYGQAFGNDWEGLAGLSEEQFNEELEQVIKPLMQTAKKLGFETNWKYRV